MKAGAKGIVRNHGNEKITRNQTSSLMNQLCEWKQSGGGGGKGDWSKGTLVLYLEALDTNDYPI